MEQCYPSKGLLGRRGWPPGFTEARKGVGQAEAHPAFPGRRTKPCPAAGRSGTPKSVQSGPPRPQPALLADSGRAAIPVAACRGRRLFRNAPPLSWSRGPAAPGGLSASRGPARAPGPRPSSRPGPARRGKLRWAPRPPPGPAPPRPRPAWPGRRGPGGALARQTT